MSKYTVGYFHQTNFESGIISSFIISDLRKPLNPQYVNIEGKTKTNPDEKIALRPIVKLRPIRKTWEKKCLSAFYMLKESEKKQDIILHICTFKYS